MDPYRDDLTSWGRHPRVSQYALPLDLPLRTEQWSRYRSVLAYGMGRSYGDCCLNDGGALLLARGLNLLQNFDAARGILRCAAGVSLDEILNFAVPRGWFLPVTPGTRFVTVGGAIANDVHGKNHHVAGTFGRYVDELILLRSDGTRLRCTPTEHQDLFAATIGGLGLTGLILSAAIRLRPIAGPYLDTTHTRFRSLDEFFEISALSSSTFEYTVAWLDCVSGGSSFGRGIFMAGNHSDTPGPEAFTESRSSLGLPLDLPGWTVNRFSSRIFNELYYRRQFHRVMRREMRYEPFFYPLDAVRNWNRVYGKKGFMQFQCTVPAGADRSALRALLSAFVDSGIASPLAVLKEFGSQQSPGMLSYPSPGITIALDIANKGRRTSELMRKLDRMVQEFAGRIYPAKDASMSPQGFARYYPNVDEFVRYRDPRFSSSLWRRVTAG